MSRNSVAGFDKAWVEKLVQVVRPHVSGDFNILAPNATTRESSAQGKGKDLELLDELQESCQGWYNELVQVLSSGYASSRSGEERFQIGGMAVYMYVNSRKYYPTILAIRN